MSPVRSGARSLLGALRWVAAAASVCGLLWWGIGRTPAASGAAPALGWQPLGGPIGRVSHLAAEPGGAHLYAVMDITARRKDDQTLWQRAGSLIRSSALYRSADGGLTWQPATNNLVPGRITALYVDSKTGVLYAAVQGRATSPSEGGSLWRSDDQGSHWVRVRLGRGDLDVRWITRTANGAYLLLGARASSGQGPGEGGSGESLVLRSRDGGPDWESFRAPPPEPGADGALADLIAHPTKPDRLFITTDSGQLWQSDDAGQTWRRLLPGESPQPTPTAAASEPPGASGVSGEVPSADTSRAYLAIAPDNPDLMLVLRQEAATTGASSSPGATAAPTLSVRRSTDGGASWSGVAVTGLPAGGRPKTLSALPAGIFLLNTSVGTYRSTDRGNTWQLLEGPLSNGDAAAFLVLSGSRPLATVLAATGYGLFLSRDAGAIWQPYGSGLPHNSSIYGLLTDARRPELIYLINNATHPGAEALSPPPAEPLPPMVLRSTDGGRTWATASPGLPDVAAMAWALDPNDPNTLFISSRAHFFRTTSAGLNWQTIPLEPGGHYALAVAPSDSNVLYLGGTPPLRSADKGLSWQSLSAVAPGAAGEIIGLAVDPSDAMHVWAAVEGEGVYESTNGGASWQPGGLPGKSVRWLSAVPGAAASPGRFALYAGVGNEGIYRWDSVARAWESLSGDLPGGSTPLAFLADPRQAGALWTSLDGGGIYRSADGGASWSNVTSIAASGEASSKGAGVSIGDNLVQALAVDHATPGGVFLGTATAGVWALRANARPSPAPPAVDARVEAVWPHGGAPVTEARLANLALRLFAPNSLLQPPCGWQPEVTVWQAVDNDPAVPIGEAQQRAIDGQPFPAWELNDVDVRLANDPQHTLHYMVRVTGSETATSVWAHGADPRTFYPYPDVPSGTATGDMDALDARIVIVWPHDEAGAGRSAAEATLINVSVAFFRHGTRLSVPVGWQPPGVTLYGAWNQEIGQPLAREAVVQVRRSGAITYPTWEFNNIPVARATDPANKLHLWVAVDGIETYPTIWTHGTDARTLFPIRDEPVQGCVP